VKKAKPIESKYIHLKIVHKEVSNIATGTMGKTWNERTVKFVWNIIRPETGMETFSTSCTNCGEKLKIDVTSIHKFTSEAKRYRSIGIAGLIGCLVFGICIYFFYKADNIGLLMTCIFGFLICLMAASLGLAVAGDSWGVVAKGSLNSGGLLNENAAGPYNQHYIETIESLQT